MKLKNIKMEERMEHYNVHGLSIALIENGQINALENYGVLEAGIKIKVDSDSVFSACSISKFLTGMLVMKLTENGALDLDEDVNNRLVSWKISDHKFTSKVTLQNLLSHQSGIIDPENSFGELVSVNGVPSMVELLEGKTPYCKEAIEVKLEPGSEFHYSDAGFCVIQQLIEDVTGKTFEKVMSELIFPIKNGR